MEVPRKMRILMNFGGFKKQRAMVKRTLDFYSQMTNKWQTKQNFAAWRHKKSKKNLAKGIHQSGLALPSAMAL